MINAKGQRFYVIALPLPPTRANARLHWRAAKKEKIDYWKKCDLALHDLGMYPFRLPPIEKSTWHAEFFVKQKGHLMDFDNMVALLKWPFDYLILRKVIVNDSWDTFWPEKLPTQRVSENKTSYLILTITEENQCKPIAT